MAKKPVHEIRMGRVKATVWENETEKGVRHNTQIRVIYKNDDGWQETDNYGRDHLPLVMKVADLAHTWIFEQGHKEDEATPS